MDRNLLTFIIGIIPVIIVIALDIKVFHPKELCTYPIVVSSIESEIWIPDYIILYKTTNYPISLSHNESEICINSKS